MLCPFPPRLEQGRRHIAGRRAGRRADRDRLRPRRRCDERRRGRAHLRGKGAARCEPADLPCGGRRDGPAFWRVRRHGRAAGGRVLARAAHAGRSCGFRCNRAGRSGRACHHRACASPSVQWRSFPPCSASRSPHPAPTRPAVSARRARSMWLPTWATGSTSFSMAEVARQDWKARS